LSEEIPFAEEMELVEEMRLVDVFRVPGIMLVIRSVGLHIYPLL